MVALDRAHCRAQDLIDVKNCREPGEDLLNLSSEIRNGVLRRGVCNWIGCWTSNSRFAKSWNGWKKPKRCRCVSERIAIRSRVRRRHRCGSKAGFQPELSRMASNLPVCTQDVPLTLQPGCLSYVGWCGGAQKTI